MKEIKKIIPGVMMLLMYSISFGQTIDTLKKNDPVPYFNMTDTSGHIMSLQHLKGKYVYIDVWASWCTPCIREYPHMAKLEEKMKDKNIIFLGISCDDVRWRWIGGMGGYKIGGNQWLLKDKAFMKAFKVDRIPRYILLDPQGKIHELNMMRPSNPALENYLNNLTNIQN